MSIYMSRAELEEISEGLITAYANQFSNHVIQSIDIEHFITEFWVKPNLSIKEASAYSRIPTSKLYEMTERQDCPFVLWIGSRRMIKRKAFEEYITNQYSI